jgi:DMSO/TMAO reductase YedYZ heme-binding membrane subunit
MPEQSPAESPPPPTSRWTASQAALVAAVVILVVVVVMTLLGQAGVLPQSDAASLNAVFLATCGLVAGVIGAGQRRQERWPGAATAYRVAMWCFVLAALHAVKYHVAAEGEAKEDRIRRASEFQEKMRQQREQHDGDTGRQPEP